MKIIEFLSKNENKQWLVVSTICVAVILCMIIVLSSKLPRRMKEIDADQVARQAGKAGQVQQVQQAQPANKNAKPVNYYPAAGQMPRADAVASPTPRIIAWMNTIIETARPAVVGICVGDAATPSPWNQGWEIATPSGKLSIGSGVLVNPKGYILTNYHVIKPLGDIVVSLFNSDGKYEEYIAVLITGYEKEDLALLKITSTAVFPYLNSADSDRVLVGDQVVAIGNPFGLSQTVTTGIISAKRSKLPIGNITLFNLFQMDVPINPGNSGGALLDLNGELIGINSAIFSPTGVYTGISFSIPINKAKKLFGKYMMPEPTLPANFNFAAAAAPVVPSAVPPAVPKKIQPSPGEGIEELAWLGIDVTPNNGPGVEVDEIEGVSPMEAGLQAGDIINAINRKKITDIYAMKDAIKSIPIKVGQGIVLDVYRPREKRSLYISFRLKEFDIMGR